MKIIGINLSNNPESINLKLLNKVCDNIKAEVVDFSLIDFPMFKAGEKAPKNLIDLCEKIKSADKIIFSSPEYNGSYSGFGKNVIDWISTQGKHDGVKKITPLSGKNVFMMSASPGVLGGVRCLPLLQILLLELGCVINGSFATTGGYNDKFDYTNVFKLTQDFKNR